MNTIATKFQVSAAACAVAAAAIVPVAAQAAPDISMPTAPVTQVLHDISLAPVALDNIAQYNWWWFGTPNPAAPPSLNLLSTHLLDPIVGWFGPWQICVLGLGLGWNSYTGLSLSFSLGGC